MTQTDPTVEFDGATDTAQPVPRGLDLFWEGTSKKAQYRYLLHFGIYVALLLTTVWPIFTVFNRIEPYVFGLPFNMFWVTTILVLVTANSVLLYRFDEGKLLGEL